MIEQVAWSVVLVVAITLLMLVGVPTVIDMLYGREL